MYKNIIITLFLGIGLFFTACEPREDPPPTPPPTPAPQHEMPAETPQPGLELTENELDEFIDASQEATNQQIDPATDRQAMEEILEDKDLNLDRFNEIQTAIHQDPALQQQVQHRIQQRQQDSLQME